MSAPVQNVLLEARIPPYVYTDTADVRRFEAKVFAEAEFPRAGNGPSPRSVIAAYPVQCEAPRRKRRAEGAADMQSAFAPIEARPAEQPAVAALALRGSNIDPEVVKKAKTGIGDCAAFGAEFDQALIRHRIREAHGEVAG